MKNGRLTRLLTFLRLLSPAHFVLACSYLRKHGVRLCFARTVFLVSMVLGLRRSAASLTHRPAAHKTKHDWGPLKRKVPDGPPPLNGCQDALVAELHAIKTDLAETFVRARKIDE